jgi:hypothetical protein
MGIDIHAFNLIKLQAKRHPLSEVLTIGRQSLDVDPAIIEMDLGKTIEITGYCEPLLLALKVKSVASIDYSDYEQATFVADLSQPVSLGNKFDTIIDAGSLEHIFDVSAAFRNTINLCRIGERIIHLLPVNNLNGHGFWQFSSDLLYSIYTPKNGFFETDVYYASSLDFGYWYKVPEPKLGERVEIVSLEPIISLSVARKVCDVDFIQVMQPFYVPAWDVQTSRACAPKRKLVFSIKALLKRLLKHHDRLKNLARNFNLLLGLMLGSSHYSLNSLRFRKIKIDQVLR